MAKAWVIAVGVLAGMAVTVGGGGGYWVYDQLRTCETELALWYEDAPGDALGIDAEQVDVAAAREACAFASRYGQPKHDALYARILLSDAIDDALGAMLATAPDFVTDRQATPEMRADLAPIGPLAARFDAVEALLRPAVAAGDIGLLPEWAQAFGAATNWMVNRDETVEANPPLDSATALGLLQRMADATTMALAAMDLAVARARDGDPYAAIQLWRIMQDHTTDTAFTLPPIPWLGAAHAAATAPTAEAAGEISIGGDDRSPWLAALWLARAEAAAITTPLVEGWTTLDDEAGGGLRPALPITREELDGLVLRAARDGFAPAQHVVGSAVLLRRYRADEDPFKGVEPAEAGRMLAAAAAAGVAPAQYNLAALLTLDAEDSAEIAAAQAATGLTVGDAEASRLLEAAAAQNYGPARIALGQAAESGVFGVRDLGQAYRHYSAQLDQEQRGRAP